MWTPETGPWEDNSAADVQVYACAPQPRPGLTLWSRIHITFLLTNGQKAGSTKSPKGCVMIFCPPVHKVVV